MNKEWSEINKVIQTQIKKEATFNDGIETLLELRQLLIDELYKFKTDLSRNEFNPNAFF